MFKKILILSLLLSTKCFADPQLSQCPAQVTCFSSPKACYMGGEDKDYHFRVEVLQDNNLKNNQIFHFSFVVAYPNPTHNTYKIYCFYSNGEYAYPLKDNNANGVSYKSNFDAVLTPNAGFRVDGLPTIFQCSPKDGNCSFTKVTQS